MNRPKMGPLCALWIVHWTERPDVFEARVMRELGRLPSEQEIAEAECVLGRRPSGRAAS